MVSIGRAGSFVSNVLYCSLSARQGRNCSCLLVVTIAQRLALDVLSWLCFPRIAVPTGNFILLLLFRSCDDVWCDVWSLLPELLLGMTEKPSLAL